MLDGQKLVRVKVSACNLRLDLVVGLDTICFDLLRRFDPAAALHLELRMIVLAGGEPASRFQLPGFFSRSAARRASKQHTCTTTRHKTIRVQIGVSVSVSVSIATAILSSWPRPRLLPRSNGRCASLPPRRKDIASPQLTTGSCRRS